MQKLRGATSRSDFILTYSVISPF